MTPKDLLEALHEAVGKGLLDRIQSGDATASDYAQAIKFLKDNGIDSIAANGNTLEQLEQGLEGRLPFTDADDPTAAYN